MSLVGKFFFFSMNTYDKNEELIEAYNFGEVVACYNESYYLLKNISNKDRITKTIYNISQMTNGDDDFWCFFDTQEELDSYIEWVETPSVTQSDDTNKVVEFNPNKTK